MSLTMDRHCDIVIDNIRGKGCCILQYLSDELRREYERWSSNNPDIQGLEVSYINVSDVYNAYFILADYFTDSTVAESERESMHFGLRSKDLLVSALTRQTVSFAGRNKYTDKLEICSTLFFGLVKNHPFLDGNKRTALLILLYQLSNYGFMPCVSVNEYEKLVTAVAANSIPITYKHEFKKFRKRDDSTIHTIAYLLRRMTKKKDHTYSVNPSMKQFCLAMEKFGVKHELKNDKIHFEREIRHWMPSRKPKRKMYAVQFGGWTRGVHAGKAREILDSLEIYDQVPNYQEFLNGCDTMYDLISKYEVPFRRLKDR